MKNKNKNERRPLGVWWRTDDPVKINIASARTNTASVLDPIWYRNWIKKKNDEGNCWVHKTTRRMPRILFYLFSVCVCVLVDVRGFFAFWCMLAFNSERIIKVFIGYLVSHTVKYETISSSGRTSNPVSGYSNWVSARKENRYASDTLKWMNDSFRDD